MPRISVIVPVYKVERYLDECVQSILQQTFTDFELILVDDGSPDNCPAMCDDYAKQDGRIKVIHQTNQGQATARNKGLQESSTPWIHFVDSDDVIHSQTLECLYKAVTRDGTELAMGDFVSKDQFTDVFSDDIDFESHIEKVTDDLMQQIAEGENICGKDRLVN